MDRLQPGDHAFLAFSDNEERWEILTVFTQQGFARDEKVVLLVDPAHSPADVAVRVAGSVASAHSAVENGQLVVSNTARFRPGEFDAGRLVDVTRHRVETTVSEGYSGLRSASEMSFALAPVDYLAQALEYEIALQESLFAGHQNRQYTALCHWDERRFAGDPVLEAVRAVHPVTLLSHIGVLHVTLTQDGVRLAGDSDLSTRAQFTAALRALADQSRDTLVLDITDLSFLDAYSASSMIRLAAGLAPPRRLEVRCRNSQRRMLHALGSRSIRQLSLVTERL